MKTPENTTIGFIGLGVMGRSMAINLLKAGFKVQAYTRTKASADDVIAAGAAWCDTLAQCVEDADVVITIVGYPRDVEQVYLGDDGILANVAAGTIVIDMTTSEPALTERLYEEAKACGVASLDAPVSGGDVGAREGRLSIMVGGDKEAFDAAGPIFEVVGGNVVYQGPAGAGQHTKMANQIAIAAGMLGVCEAVAYAVKSGLDPETVLASISGGAAGSWSLSNLAPRMIAGNFDPGFFVKHFIKDMTIAQQSARQLTLDTPGLDLAKSLYEKLAGQGGENDGTQSLYKLYAKQDEGFVRKAGQAKRGRNLRWMSGM